MKRIAATLGFGALAVVFLTAGLRLVEDYIILPSRAYSELPVHPKYARGIAYDATAKTPVYSTTGSVWRQVANAKGGTNSTIIGGEWYFDGGVITLAETFAAAPSCICGLTHYDGGTGQSVACPSTTSTVTPMIAGGATLGNELIKYHCVGTLP